MRRSIELVSGILTAAVGLAGLAYAVFGPTGRYMTSGTISVMNGTTRVVSPGTSGTTSLWQEGLEPRTIVFLLVIALALIGVAASVYLHS